MTAERAVFDHAARGAYSEMRVSELAMINRLCRAVIAEDGDFANRVLGTDGVTPLRIARHLLAEDER